MPEWCAIGRIVPDMIQSVSSPVRGGPIRVYRVHHASGEPSVGEDVEVWEIRPERHIYLGLGRLVGFVRRAPLSRRLPFEGHAPEDDSPEEWAYREQVYRARGVEFLIAGSRTSVHAADDVRLPIVERLHRDGYVPDYPRCPDCGGALGKALPASPAGRLPGGLVCEGTPPKMVECEACYGEGVVPCPVCNPEGDVTEETQCETCNTLTVVDCPECKGKGALSTACGSAFVDSRY